MIADEPVSFHLILSFFFRLCHFLDAQASLAQSVDWLVGNTFGFPFCQRLLTKRRDAIAVAAMVADMVADIAADKNKKNKQIGRRGVNHGG